MAMAGLGCCTRRTITTNHHHCYCYCYCYSYDHYDDNYSATESDH